MAVRRILVTGASGYIAGKLIPRLLAAGHQVRCMVRTRKKIAYRSWARQVEIVEADVSQPETLPAALVGIDTAYYLIHNMSSGHGYQKIELAGAEAFALAAEAAGVEHLIYLGGLADPEDEIAPHMRSRIETGVKLREHPVPVTEFRAGVIVGPGSISFEMIRYVCEQFPVLVGPAWLKNYSQPISAENVIDYLVAALENPNCRGQVFEIGGPKRYTYAEVMLTFARLRGLQRPIFLFPFLPTALMATFVGWLSPVPKAIARPLIEGLNSDSVVKDPKALTVFPEIEPTGYEQAVQNSLEKLHPDHLDRIWVRGAEDIFRLMHEGFFVECLHTPVITATHEVVPRLSQLAQTHLGEYQLEVRQADCLLLRMENGYGSRWVEWRLIEDDATGRYLRQTGFYAPRGLPGFLASWRWQTQLRGVFRLVCEQLCEIS